MGLINSSLYKRKHNRSVNSPIIRTEVAPSRNMQGTLYVESDFSGCPSDPTGVMNQGTGNLKK